MLIIKRILKFVDETNLPVRFIAYSYLFLSGLLIVLAIYALALQAKVECFYFAIILSSKFYGLSGLWTPPKKIPFAQGFKKVLQHPAMDRFLMSLAIDAFVTSTFLISKSILLW